MFILDLVLEPIFAITLIIGVTLAVAAIIVCSIRDWLEFRAMFFGSHAARTCAHDACALTDLEVQSLIVLEKDLRRKPKLLYSDS